MSRKSRFGIELVVAGLAAACLVLGVCAAFTSPLLLLVALAVLLVVFAVLWLYGQKLSRQIAALLSGRVFQNSGLQYTLARLPDPVVVLSDERAVWYNDAFRGRLLKNLEHPLEKIGEVLPGFSVGHCVGPNGQLFSCQGRQYRAVASALEGGLTIVVLTDQTNLREIAAEYTASRPVYMIIDIDGYEEIFDRMRDSERARSLEKLNRILEHWFGKTTGFLRRVSESRYIAVIEERHVQAMIEAKFDVLDKVRCMEEGVPVTLSIGVGRGGSTLAECQDKAKASLDMALGRGGDQAVIQVADGFEFYGGVARSVERRSKVKSRLLASSLIDLIRQSDSVVAMGHRLSDLDCVGASIGIMRICATCGVPSVIAVDQTFTLAQPLFDYFNAEGYGDYFTTPEEALRYMTPRTLLVIVDTFQQKLLENAELLKKCGKVVVIDHHRKAVGHVENPVLIYHETSASSACELVTELLQYTPMDRDNQLRPIEAEALLSGIQLDTRGYALNVGVHSFEAAAYLRRMGAKPENVKRLFNVSLEEYTARAALVERAVIYQGCAVSVSNEPAPGAAVAQAANDLMSIGNVEASFVAVEKGDTVNISARSMGAVNVQLLLEALGGGGHLTMAGAQLKGCTAQQAERMLLTRIDEYRQEQAETALREKAEMQEIESQT